MGEYARHGPGSPIVQRSEISRNLLTYILPETVRQEKSQVDCKKTKNVTIIQSALTRGNLMEPRNEEEEDGDG